MYWQIAIIGQYEHLTDILTDTAPNFDLDAIFCANISLLHWKKEGFKMNPSWVSGKLYEIGLKNRFSA